MVPNVPVPDVPVPDVPAPHAPNGAGPAPRAVLVVDDSPEDAEVVRRHLRRASSGMPADHGYAVRHVQLAADALDAVRDPARRPDVLLLDHGLPDMSGLELLDLLAAEPGGAPVPVVMLTGTHAHIDTAVAAMRGGALDYLAKDALGPDALRRALDNAMERFASARLVAAQRDELERLYAAEQAARAEAQAARAQADEARAVAEVANRAKSDFLASMSHELRTPLNAVGGYVQLLEMGIHGPVTDAQREALGRVRLAQAHLLALITDVLNFAKLEAGKVEYDMRDADLAEVLADVGQLVEPQLEAKGHTYTAPAPGALAGAAGRVWADRDKLRQVLLNLLSNAVKFTPAGGRIAVRVVGPHGTELSAHGGEGAEGLVRLVVEDTGVGIPADRLDAIFDPFVQVTQGRTRPHEGTGLGLAISRDLARGMGGDLTAESTPGAGSTFTLTLPASAAVAELL